MITHEILQEVVVKLKQDPENTKCFDCEKPEPSFASINHGIFICSKCASNHKMLGQEISEVKSIEKDKWDISELRHLVAGGNSAFREFLTCYGLRSEPSIFVKYRTRAAMFYRSMLSVVSNYQPYVAFMPSYELGRMVNHDIKIYNTESALKAEPRAIELQEIKSAGSEIIEPPPQKTGFFRWIYNSYGKFVKFGNKVFESLNEFGNTPTMRRLEAKSLIFAESYDRLFSVFSTVVNDVCMEEEPKELSHSEVYYRKVFADTKHTFHSINFDPKIKELKLDIMNMLKPPELERKVIDEDVVLKLQTSKTRIHVR
ncbi:unnamed protein product [Blepharisma stoltei]|uniref:Arf-GAP domain-containing protein n=1 Tax=Blepharisma stoltei TaxID=1481888 RepID=A0AAU9J946_9CILI|nr:unnamed protein product [Blepharisma stoltei]